MPPLHIKDPTAADILPWLIDAMTNTVVDVAWLLIIELTGRHSCERVKLSGEAYQHRRATMRHTNKTRSLFIIFPRGPTSSLFCLVLPISHGYTTPRVTLFFMVMTKQKIGSLFENKLTNSRLLVCANVQWVDLSSNSMSVRTGNCCWRLADSG